MILGFKVHERTLLRIRVPMQTHLWNGFTVKVSMILNSMVDTYLRDLVDADRHFGHPCAATRGVQRWNYCLGFPTPYHPLTASNLQYSIEIVCVLDNIQ